MNNLLRNTPAAPHARLLLAHGAGAAMDTPFMNRMAEGLCAADIEVWRFEFPYMAGRRAGGSKRPPDRQPVLLDSWRDCIQGARVNWSGPLFIGGKSMGGRMASLLADEEAIDGLVCLGYPFHPPGKPDKLRTDHLRNLRTPSLIIQGSRDPLGNRTEVADYTLAPSIQLYWLEDGDHDLKPRVKSGFTHEQHLTAAVDVVSEFIKRTARIL
jgi:uncharacterized protein